MSGAGIYLDPDADRLLLEAPTPRALLFLDRDGVINLDHGYVHRAEETSWLPGIFDLCARAYALGMPVVVVTNQAGIARGLYSEEAFLAYTRWMHEQFSARSAPLLATMYCPHHPDAGIGALKTLCDCRKPAPGMILDAWKRFDADLPRSILVGNRVSDMLAAQAAAIGTRILLDDEEDATDMLGPATQRVGSMADIRFPGDVLETRRLSVGSP